MIRVPVKTRQGVYKVMRTRVPRTRTFELYRKAEEESPKLVEQIYAVISQDVAARPTEPSHRATVLIGRIPSDWPCRAQWLKFADSESARRSLFEQVLWTYFFDQKETWETTWPDKGRTDAEYARIVPPPSVVQAPHPGQESATAAPEPSIREIGPSASPPPPATRGMAPPPTRGMAPPPTRGMAPPASRGMAPVAPAPEETLKAGDTVEIVNHTFQGMTGVVVALVDDDGLKTVTVRMQVAGLLEEISGFLPSQLRKV